MLSAAAGVTVTIGTVPSSGAVGNNFVLVKGNDDTGNNTVIVTEYDNSGQGIILHSKSSQFVVSTDQTKYWEISPNAGWVTVQNSSNSEGFRVPGSGMLSQGNFLPACFELTQGHHLKHTGSSCTTDGAELVPW